MNRRPQVIAEFIDRYDEKRIVGHDERGRLRIKRNREVPSMEMTKAVGRIIGQRVRAERLRQKLPLAELARRAGLTPTKERMLEIESATRNGVRIGTLYCLAHALGVHPTALLPDLTEALQAAGVAPERGESLTVRAG